MTYYMNTISGKIYTESEILKSLCKDYEINFDLFEDIDDFLVSRGSNLKDFNFVRIDDKPTEK